MGTLEQKWGPNGDPKTEKGPHGDRVPQMGTHVGTVHIQKAVHLRILKIRLKFNFRHPVERQIFGDGDGLDPALILALCHIPSTSTNTTENTQI